jgi:hypothetical protein
MLTSLFIFLQVDTACRVERVVQSGHLLVGSVDGQRVLDEIVGADTDEIHVSKQPVQNPDGPRNFHHDPLVHIPIKGNPLMVKEAFFFFQDRRNPLYLLH